ncbi:MAG TPA: hypothetical protein VMN58_08675 [Acidimicrobiales bacterium]|nr:hypothetical protein [Acidimicrobiales bacterium]
MDITLVARFEWVDDAQEPSWWADSPQDPGFYAAASSLGALQREAEDAIRWAHEEEDLSITWDFDDVPPLAGAISRLAGIGTACMLNSGQRWRSQTVVVYGFKQPVDVEAVDFHSPNRLLVR